jgi:hypothetical protein
MVGEGGIHREDLGVMEKILLHIPGFHGYKEKELRREADRLLRNSIYKNLDQAERSFREALTMLSGPLSGDIMQLIDIIIYRLQRIKDGVRVADSGYSGFFDLVKVREDLLDKVMSLDVKLLEISEKVLDDVKKLSGKGFTDIDSRNRLLMIIESLKVIEKRFDERVRLLAGLG